VSNQRLCLGAGQEAGGGQLSRGIARNTGSQLEL
jgi:hypothetical protein